MCGIIGLFGFDDISRELAFGMTALQHRGQDAAGIVTFERNFRIRKGTGLVGQVFNETSLARLKGPIGLGHIRYATQGNQDVENAQPIYMNFPSGLAMVHNGNVINFKELSRNLQQGRRIIETTNDLELMLFSLASHLERQEQGGVTPDSVFAATAALQNDINGGYAAIALLANQGLLAFCDPNGLRPLVFGKRITSRGPAFAFASETACLEAMGYQVVRELSAGEAVFIDMERQVHSRVLHRKRPAFCIFELIYFAREDSVIRNRLVAGERVRMGKLLAKPLRESGLSPDIIIDVPSSAYFFASGLAEELNVPYRRGLSKNKYVGRSFLFPTPDQRTQAVRQKLSPLKPVIAGRKIAVVDDSIVRGTTSKHLVELLREGGASEVYFVSAAPPVMFPCVYGIDMSMKTELIAANNKVEDIARFIKADAVIYQSLADLRSLYGDDGFCDACFSGEFPTNIPADALEALQKDRMSAQADCGQKGRDRNA
jgi:amidophosphoribosyltransferase